jgi:hypothetical protein
MIFGFFFNKSAHPSRTGTPGKALDWSLKFKFFDLKKISVFVLDEADVMIATQGHQDQSIRLDRKSGNVSFSKKI